MKNLTARVFMLGPELEKEELDPTEDFTIAEGKITLSETVQAFVKERKERDLDTTFQVDYVRVAQNRRKGKSKYTRKKK